MLAALGLSGPLLVAMAVAALSAMSFFVVFGAGQFNVSQPGFLAIGAYAVAMTTTHGGSPVWGVLIGLAVSAPAGALLVAVAKKLSGVYLAIATLAFVEVIQEVITLTPWFNGPLGIYGIPVLVTPLSAWLVVAAVALFLHQFMRSRIGMEMTLLREDVILAKGAGANELRIRLVTGALSASIAAVAGAMTALSTSYISPDEFGFGVLIATMSFVIIGGSERYWGGIVGAVALTILPEVTRVASDYRPLMSGALLLFVVLLAPEGIAGAGIRLRVAYRKRRRGHRTGGDADSVAPSAGQNPSAVRR